MAMQSSIVYSFAISLTIVCIPLVYGQLNSPCTASMLTSFNPCMSFLTSGSNITQPPAECCDALRSLMSNGTNCMCQIATGTIPFRLPINRTMAVSLPRACNMPGGVTLQCKTSSDAAPAPGPTSDGSSITPEIAPTLSPQASVDPLSPTSTSSTGSTPVGTEAPTTTIENAERRPSDNPAASSAALGKVSLLLLPILGAIVLGSY